MEKLLNPEIPDRHNYRQVVHEVLNALKQVPEAELLIYRKLQMKYSVPGFE
jgi:hypothetical protein